MVEDGFATTLMPANKIKPPLFQCRSASLDENLDELVDSIKTVGLLEPLIIRLDKEKQPELVIGSRRLKACLKAGLHTVSVVIRELTDEQALEIEGSENLNRNDLLPEEKTRLVCEWAKRGYDANGIAKKVHKSYTWVVSFLPSEFKDKVKAEAGKLGGEAKAATISVAQLVESEEKARGVLIECSGCKMGTREDQVKMVGGKPYCSGCAPTASVAYQNEQKRLEQPEKPVTPRELSTYAHREAERHVLHSRQEMDFVKLLEDDGSFGPVIQDRTLYAVSSVPDAYLPKVRWICYVDGEPHEGREEKDEKLRDLIGKANDVRVFVFKIGEGKPADWLKKLKELT